jgi:hypothetical protein
VQHPHPDTIDLGVAQQEVRLDVAGRSNNRLSANGAGPKTRKPAPHSSRTTGDQPALLQRNHPAAEVID